MHVSLHYFKSNFTDYVYFRTQSISCDIVHINDTSKHSPNSGVTQIVSIKEVKLVYTSL
jgi:hypothetical protein